MTARLGKREALMVLNALPHIGPVTLRRLLEALGGDAASVLEASPEQLLGVHGVGEAICRSLSSWRETFDLVRAQERLRALGLDFVIAGDAGYPALLCETYDPPLGLYRNGGYNCKADCIAVIGSRRASPYGLAMARNLGAGLAEAGFCVVSGLARGIDTAAHEGALSVGGATVAVLGNGIDIIYPPENGSLYRRIAETGAVLSEFPPGRPADRQSFAMRNRIVSGMCRAVVVVESDVDGGAMITARFAAEQGRIVCAIPGRVDQATSRGCHQLIRDGVTLVTSVEEVLDELQYPGDLPRLGSPKAGAAAAMRSERRQPAADGARVQTRRPVAALENRSAKDAKTPAKDSTEGRILEALRGGEELNLESLVAQLGLDASVLGAALMLLELDAWIQRKADGAYVLAASPATGVSRA